MSNKNTLEHLIRTYPGYEMTIQFCPENRNYGSIIGYYNYYDQLFPEIDIPVDLHLCFFDTDGQEIAAATETVPTHGYVQLDAGRYVRDFTGLVTTMAVPKQDVHRLAQGKFSIRKQVSTGYYLMWHDRQGHADVMHEWVPLAMKGGPIQRHFVTLDNHSGHLKWGLVLMNRNAHEGSENESCPRLEIFTSDRKTLGTATLKAIPRLGTTVLDLEEVFPQINVWLERNRTLGLSVESKNLAGPFSFERHTSGDFHIHHF